MKRKRHSREHIRAQIRDVSADLAAGVPPDQVCAKHGISVQTLRRWLRQFGQGDSDTSGHRLKLLEHENQRLRRAVAALELEKQVLSEAVRGNF